MGHISIVYGHIIGATWRSEDYCKLQRLNKAIIANLPDNEDTFPWIEKNMFAVPDPLKDKIYRDQVIAFGTSYKSVEYEWDEWIEKFENILRQLYWTSAKIHLETELVGNHTYNWLYDFDEIDNFLSDNYKPVTKWSFEGGPRKFYEGDRKLI